MVHALQIYRVHEARVEEFISAFRDGGSWREFSRQLTGHIFTEVLRSHDYPGLFVVIEFWQSIEARNRADAGIRTERNREHVRRLSWSGQDLGVFSFPVMTCDVSCANPRCVVDQDTELTAWRPA